jgi:hypothetical protein
LSTPGATNFGQKDLLRRSFGHSQGVLDNRSGRSFEALLRSSSALLSYIGSDIDDGDEAGWARERDEEKVGCGLGNLSKVSRPNWVTLITVVLRPKVHGSSPVTSNVQ